MRAFRRLHAYLSATFPFPWQITIVDNRRRPTARGSAPSDWPRTSLRCARRHPRRKGPRPGAAGGVEQQRRDGCSPIWTSISPPTFARAAPLVAPLVSGHSDSRSDRG